MTPIRSQTVDDKLFRLNQYIVFIEDILTKSDDEILKDPAVYNGLEHMMQLSMQIIFDIGGHILVEDFSINPKTYEDIIISLGDKSVIDKDFAISQSEMSKFRNKLVHDYDTIEPKKVISYARQAPTIFRTFAKAFIAHIDNTK